jgi:hypothetical protein
MDMMAYAGCINSVAVLVFTSSSFDEYTFVHKVILFLVTEQVLVLFKLLMNIIIPSDTAFTKMLLKRQDFITKKFLMGFDDDDDALSLNDLKGNLTDFEENVVESLNLYDIRKAKQFTEKDYEMMESLESKRRDLLGETRLAKGQLQRVHKSEVLNEQTGIGETKHGLPLGRLSVKLVNIEGLGLSPKMQAERDAIGIQNRFRQWIEDKRNAAGRTPKRYPNIEAAYERMKTENSYLTDEQARHLTVHGISRNEDGSWSWKFDNYLNIWAIFDMPREDLLAIWQSITCPMLMMYGANSWASNPEKDGRIAHFPTAKVVEYENAGHWLHHDQFDRFMADVRAFL